MEYPTLHNIYHIIKCNSKSRTRWLCSISKISIKLTSLYCKLAITIFALRCNLGPLFSQWMYGDNIESSLRNDSIKDFTFFINFH